MPLQFAHTCYDDLSVRAKGIFHRIGTLEDVLEYFKLHGNFLKLKSSGIKTDLELRSLCEFCLAKMVNISDEKPLAEQDIIPLNIMECLDYYQLNKRQLTRRLQNVLQSLEEESNFDLGQEYQIHFFLKYILSYFDILTINNCGKKVAIEFERFVVKLRQVTSEQKVKLKNDYSDDIVSKIYRKLEYKLSKEEITTTINRDEGFYDPVSLFAYYVLSQDVSELYITILKNLYFTEYPNSQEELAKQLKRVKERIRQIEINIKKHWLPDLLFSFQSALSPIPNNIQRNTSKFIKLTSEDSSPIHPEEYPRPNFSFKRLVYSSYLKSDYFSISDFVDLHSEKLKSFEIKNDDFYLSNQVASSIQIENFLIWVDTEIFNFFLEDFDYNLNVLIKRYYQENNIDIDQSFIAILEEIVRKYLREDWSDFGNFVRKIHRKKIKNSLVDQVTQFLERATQPQKTDRILAALREDFNEVNKDGLLKILNNHPSQFKRLGSGYWSINKLEDDVHGTLQEIVFKKLNDSDNPLHISELISFINAYRPITENSLRTNLKSNEDNNFVFLNCGYVGLKGKLYKQNWNSLPKVTGSIVRAIKRKHQNIEDRIQHLTAQYHVPYIHAQYIFKK